MFNYKSKVEKSMGLYTVEGALSISISIMYDKYWFWPDGKHKDTHTLTDKKWFKKDWIYVYTWDFFDLDGFDRDWYDKDFRDRQWYNEHWYDKYWNKKWNDKQWWKESIEELPIDYHTRTKQR